MQDKEMKMKLLEELMESMGSRMSDRDLKPMHEGKSKLVIKAEGDDPEEMKDEVVDKLEGIELPDEEAMAEMSSDEDMEDERVEEEGEDDYLAEMPVRMREKIMEMRKKKEEEEYS